MGRLTEKRTPDVSASEVIGKLERLFISLYLSLIRDGDRVYDLKRVREAVGSSLQVISWWLERVRENREWRELEKEIGKSGRGGGSVCAKEAVE